MIDYIYVCESESAADSIKTIKPHFYVKGPDYKNNKLDKTKKIFLEKKLVKKIMAKLFIPKMKFSSSSIINENNLLNYNHAQKNFIEISKKNMDIIILKMKLKNLKNKNIISWRIDF